MSASTALKRVALIIASTRSPRIGPAVSKIALEVITPLLPPHITLNVVDLMDHPLPLYTAEPLVPSRIPRPLTFNSYADPATNAWSALISSFDGFIIVTPQHNWGYPASLKLALDALFHEWTGKPVLLVTYGGWGGVKAAEQLRQVLGAMRLRVCTRAVELWYAKGHDPSGGVIEKETYEKWTVDDTKEQLTAAWEELASLLNTER